MADPLSLLRQYNMQKKQIIERDNNIIFGEFSWPKTVKTNYSINGKTNEYYTLECLLYLLKNINLQHPKYVRKAVQNDVPIIRRPDRKELLLYLQGKTNSAPSIDKSALLEMPTQAPNIVKSEPLEMPTQAPSIVKSEPLEMPTQAPSIVKSEPLEMPTQAKRTADDTLEGSDKKPRFDDAASQKLKDQRKNSVKLEAKYFKDVKKLVKTERQVIKEEYREDA